MAWASAGPILVSDETTIQPSQLSRHEAQKIEEGCRWCPRRARHVSDTTGCCRRIARIYLAWAPSFAVLGDVRSWLLRDDARECWCGCWRSCSMARLSKIRKAWQTTPRSFIMPRFLMEILEKTEEIKYELVWMRAGQHSWMLLRSSVLRFSSWNFAWSYVFLYRNGSSQHWKQIVTRIKILWPFQKKSNREISRIVRNRKYMWYVIVVWVRISKCGWDNKCMHSITKYTIIDIYLIRVHLMYSVSTPKNETFIDGQSCGSWGAFFTWFQNVTVLE